MEKLLEKFNINSKKGIENLVIFLVLVIIVIVVINGLYVNENELDMVQTVTAMNDTKSNELEERMERILSMIEGAGSVKVLISYSNTTTQVPLYDTKENVVVTETNGDFVITFDEVANAESYTYRIYNDS